MKRAGCELKKVIEVKYEGECGTFIHNCDESYLFPLYLTLKDFIFLFLPSNANNRRKNKCYDNSGSNLEKESTWMREMPSVWEKTSSEEFLRKAEQVW